MSDVRPANLARIFHWGYVFTCWFLLFPNIVQSATSNSATLQWAANLEPDLAGYRIYHGTLPGVYGVPQTIGKTTTYLYPNLVSGKTHYFTITAYDVLGNESLPSPEVFKSLIANTSSSSPADSTSQTVSSTTSTSNGQTEPSTHTANNNDGSGKPALLTPIAGSILSKGTTTFTWTANGANLTDWVLRIGNSPGNASFYNSGNLPSETQLHIVSEIPSNGTKVWVRLEWRYSNGTWSSTDIQYATSTGSGSSNASNLIPSTNVFWRNTTSGEVAVWLMDGGSLTSVGFPGSASPDWKIEQVGDMNGDGQMDMLWRNTSGMVAVWLMNEATIISSGFLGGVPAEWVIKAIGDLNGDGKADVVWRNSQSGMVAVWFLNGKTIMSVGYLGITPKAWEIEKVGDVNGDGKADLVWQNRKSGTVAIWLMNGLEFLSVGFPASTSTKWKIQSLGDINGDGKMDVLWRNASGMVAVWLMNGTTIASYNFVGGVPLEWEIKQVSDVNGDGKADVVFQSQSSGVVAVWMMNGLNVSSIGYPGSTPVNWKIYN